MIRLLIVDDSPLMRRLLGSVFTDEGGGVTLFKRLKRRKPTEEAPKTVLFLRSEYAPCTCPDPCERDHGNE